MHNNNLPNIVSDLPNSWSYISDLFLSLHTHTHTQIITYNPILYNVNHFVEKKS